IYYRPDNLAPFKRGWYDNYHPTEHYPQPWEECPITMGTGDDLDISYHYWGACYKGNNDFTTSNSLTASAITLRHPKEAAGEIQYTINESVVTFYPSIPESAKTIAIASSAYGENHEEKTISCFGSNIYLDSETYINHSLVLYRRFRGYADAYGVVDHYQTPEGGVPYINRIAMTAGSGATGGSMAEPIYLGVVVTYGDWPGFLSQLEINIYRYEPDPENWIKIGNKTISWDICYKRHIDDIALAANGNDLWVFWLYSYIDENENSIRDFRGYRIQNSSGRTMMDTISGNSAFFVPDTIPGEVINADWDNIINMTRLIWTQIDGGYYKTRAGRVELDPVTKQPIHMVDFPSEISNNSNDNAINPSIAVNNSEYDEFRAFAGFTFGENSSIVKCKLINGDDVWQQPENYYGVTPDDSYITYSYFGNPQFIWMESETIKIKDEIVAEGNHYHECLQLKTNRYNNTDIYTSYGEDQNIIIQELHP
ncbi:MAG: hypothetical protein NT106_08670, partial [Candidatus Sumerlaeota bacterium]|nr:hypothetical protein [Candidatus Sumerlaeota bacterium]